MYEHISKCVRKGRKVYYFSAFFFALFADSTDLPQHISYAVFRNEITLLILFIKDLSVKR